MVLLDRWRGSLDCRWISVEHLCIIAGGRCQHAALFSAQPELQRDGHQRHYVPSLGSDNGTNGQSGVNVSTNGGSTAFSAAFDTANITIIQNDIAPVVDLNGGGAATTTQ